MIFFFMLIFSNTYSQYVFQADTLPEEISLHKYATIADVGQKELNIQYIMSHYDALNPRALKRQTMI
jgi:hypothetical protein